MIDAPLEEILWMCEKAPKPSCLSSASDWLFMAKGDEWIQGAKLHSSCLLDLMCRSTNAALTVKTDCCRNMKCVVFDCLFVCLFSNAKAHYPAHIAHVQRLIWLIFLISNIHKGHSVNLSSLYLVSTSMAEKPQRPEATANMAASSTFVVKLNINCSLICTNTMTYTS